MSDKIHVFEQAGLGVAPFKLVRAYYGPLAGCDYCYTAIRIHCIIRDANGHEFKVGNVCVNKTYDQGLIDQTKREVNRLKREAKAERDKARIAKAKELLPDVKELLESKGHPAIPNKTYYDYVVWMFDNAGNAGMIKVSRVIEKAHKSLQELLTDC